MEKTGQDILAKMTHWAKMLIQQKRYLVMAPANPPECLFVFPSSQQQKPVREEKRGREVERFKQREIKKNGPGVCVCVYLCGSVTSDWESEKADSLNEIADKRNSWPCLTL